MKILFFALAMTSALTALSATETPLPTEYITGTNSVCPNTPYKYTLYSSGCTVTSYSWNITGGYETSGPGGGGGGGEDPPIESIIGKPSPPTPMATEIGFIWIIWNSSSIGLTASINTPDPCNSVATVIGGLSLKVPNAKPNTPSSITVSGQPSLKYCPGQSVTLTSSAPENSNGSTTDNVSFMWEVSINGEAYTYFSLTSSSTTTYTAPSAIFTNPNQSQTMRFRVRTRYNQCTSAESDYTSASAPVYLYPTAPSITSSDYTIAPRICTDAGSLTINSITTQGDASTTYFLQVQDIGSYTFTGSQLPFTIPVGLTNGTYNYQLFYYDTPNSTPAPCSSSGSFVVADGSYALSLTPAVTNETCSYSNNGRVDLTHGNGLAPYTYLWTNTSQTTQNITNLTGTVAGTSYTATVTDDHGCTGTAVGVVHEPQTLVVSGSVTKSITCPSGDDGEITSVGFGGTGPYTYSIGSGFQGPTNFPNLVSNNYTITIKDANGCTATSASIPLGQPNAIGATFTKTDATCYGYADGTITVTASGGTAGYTYSKDGTNYQPGNVFVGLAAGSYSITIKDSKGCTKSIAAPAVGQPGAIAITASSVAVSCSGLSNGSVTVTAPTGAGFTYSLDGEPFQSGVTFSGLPAGAHSLTAKNSAGCTNTISVTVSSPSAVGGSIAVSNPISCFGGNNGALNLTPSGGTGPYTFVWSNSATTEDLSGLVAGTYAVTIKDNNNCTGSASIVLGEPAILSATAEPSDYNGSALKCNGDNTGAITLTPFGGTSPYTYTWSTGATTKDISGLTANSYSVTVKDNRNCTVVKNVTLTAPPAISLSTSAVQHVKCSGGDSGAVTLSASGGTGTYLYSPDGGASWQPGNQFSGLTAGSKTFLVRDVNNCQASINVTITQPAPLSLTETVQNTTCGQANGAIQVIASGGASPYNYAWYNSSAMLIGNGSQVSSLVAGIYQIQITDQNACIVSKVITISSSNGPSITSTSTTTTCPGGSDGTAEISISGGTLPYTVK
ncbi:MAG: SprB repeat-containing protein, partial [Bacteroidota bacterium]